MMRGRNLSAIASFTLFAMGVSAGTGAPSREKFVQSMDDYYQAQFADLSLTKRGKFGTSRIEQTEIQNHGREGGDPGYGNRDWVSSVTIWGNHGKALDPLSIASRYHRFGGGQPSHPAYLKAVQNGTDLGVREAAKRFRRGDLRPYVWKSGNAVAEARAIRLSKPQCLPCHFGLKQGNPVAVIVYTTAPKLPRKVASRERP